MNISMNGMAANSFDIIINVGGEVFGVNKTDIAEISLYDIDSFIPEALEMYEDLIGKPEGALPSTKKGMMTALRLSKFRYTRSAGDVRILERKVLDANFPEELLDEVYNIRHTLGEMCIEMFGKF